MLFYKRSTWLKHLRGIGLVPMDAACWVSWGGEGIEAPYSRGSSWKLPSVHCLLSFAFVPFLIFWPFSTAASSVSWYWSCLVCSRLVYEIYSGGGPSTYVYCVVCYYVIAAPYVRSVGDVFAYLYTLDDASELWDYETSLLPKVFALDRLQIFCEQLYCRLFSRQTNLNLMTTNVYEIKWNYLFHSKYRIICYVIFGES